MKLNIARRNLGLMAAILVDDRQDDQAEGQEAGEVEEGLVLLGEVAEGEEGARYGVDAEGDGEEQKEAVLRIQPEADEEHRRDHGGHGDGAEYDRVRHHGYLSSKISP